MKRITLATFLMCIASAFVFAQTGTAIDAGTPAGAGEKNLANDDVKLRSIELERIKREAKKAAMIRRDDGVELNFGIIKNDFEGIQLKQGEIIRAYQTGDEIDYEKINASTGEMTEMAIRLKSNLFLAEDDKKDSTDDSEEKNPAEKSKKSVRNLIVALDNAIGSFVSNKMFQNLKVIDPELSNKAESDLDKIITLSGDLWLESNKMKSK